MTMPVELFAVRHFESDRNFANDMLRHHNDDSFFTKELIEQPSAFARITKEGGEAQAPPTGAWLQSNAGLTESDGYFVSSYIRAMESAYLLRLPSAQWHRRNELRELSAGDWEHLSSIERRRRIGEQPVKTAERDPWNWKAPNGESFADVSLRLWQFCHLLHEGYSHKRAVVMCHGYVLLALRYHLERWPDEEFRRIFTSRDPNYTTHNGIILHYTRHWDPVNPDDHPAPYYTHVRSICAWDPSLVDSGWKQIKRKLLSNEDLEHLVKKHPHLIET